MTKEQYPSLHSILFDSHVTICLSLGIFIVWWFCIHLKRGCLRYQFSRLGFAIIMGIIVAHNCLSIQFFSTVGVFWIVFVPLIIAANDAFAYLVGKSFGRTPLIKLSPNKTLEGFLGGALFTFVFIIFFMGSMLNQKTFISINYKMPIPMF